MKITLINILFVLLSQILFAQNSFPERLSEAALKLTEQDVTYDPAYFSIDYPNGDIPAGKGVCTDVIIRAYRQLDIDLQKEVHEDMASDFEDYPNF